MVDWTNHFKRQNCVSSKIANYLAVDHPMWSRLVNSVLEKCVNLMVAYAALPNKQYTFGPNNYKYYCRSIINQWTSKYHYPSIDFESRIEIIHSQYAEWNARFVGVGAPPDWNIFRNLKWSHALSLMKSLGQGYINIKDIPENSSADVGMKCFDFDTNYFFVNIRDFTHNYLGKLRGPQKFTLRPLVTPAAVFDQGTINDKKRNGIGYIPSRLNKVRNISGWDHSGPLCKNQEQIWMTTYNNISPFSSYILESIPIWSPNKPARHNLPIQCSISGSTNMILSTLLWGTENIALSQEELCKIVLGIIALLCLDGGHTFQEVLTAVCLISNFYFYFITHHMHSVHITCFNNTTITNLYVALRNLEFLPRNIINNELVTDPNVGPYTQADINNVRIIFSNYDMHNYRPTNHVYPEEYVYKIFVCDVMNICMQETNTAGQRYFSFWTDTFEYINMSLLYMLNSTVEYNVMRRRSGVAGDIDGNNGNWGYNGECRGVCDNVAIGGGGIASSKNKKNKKAASPRTLPLATLERSSRTQLSFGSPRARKYRLRGSPPSTASSPQLRRPRRANH